jgi:para-aminobenzoate synthetase/4-amino-4-deoxychorismate lyase
MFERARSQGFDDVLFMNERGEITEGAISNVFVEAGGTLYTPPVANGALQGVYRRHILETTSAAVKTLFPSDLSSADAVYICNAIRGMRRVEWNDTARLHPDPRNR